MFYAFKEIRDLTTIKYVNRCRQFGFETAGIEQAFSLNEKIMFSILL